MEDKKVSVIIPCFNGRELVLSCLEAVLDSKTNHVLEIIVVDNGSSDGTYEAVGGFKGVLRLRFPENRGFAGAVNSGLHASTGRYIAVLHNDVIVPARWLDPMIAAIESDAAVGIAGPRTNWTTGSQWEQNAAYGGPEELERYCAGRTYFSGYEEAGFVKDFCMVFPRDLVYSIGGFDERYFPARVGDEDFCFRARVAGYRTVIVPEAFVHHIGSATLSMANEPAADILKRNVQKFFDKHKVPAKSGAESIIQKSSGGEENRHTPVMIEGMLREANREFAEGRLEEAEQLYLRLHDQAPDSLEIMFNLGILSIQRNMLDRARSMISEMLRLDAAFAPAHYADGLLSLRHNRHDHALDCFKRAVYHDVNYRPAYKSYRETAEFLGRRITGRKTDIVFYTAGMSFDGNTINEQSLGGSESAMYHMARELSSMGLSVRVYNKCNRPGTYDGVEYGDLADFYIFNFFNHTDVFISSRSFRPFVHPINAKRYIVWLHDTVDSAYFQNIDKSSLDWEKIEPFVLSKWQAKTWAAYLGLPVEKFYITRNGIDPGRFDIEAPERRRNKLVYSSRPVRGLEILLDVFPRIRREIADAELHIFTYALLPGDSEGEPFRQKLDQPGVLVRGSVSQKELAREMMEARLLAYPCTFEETSCITAIEAQAAGLPVVTSAIAAMPETVADGVSGVVVPGDPRSEDFQERFVAAVIGLMRDDETWKRLSEAGVRRVWEQYHWKKIAREWSDYIFGDRFGNAGPKLSLCMIVKNEADLLPDFFNHVRDLVDEIVVVDTGSTDETALVARTSGALVVDFPWSDDFAAARNESLKHASGDWILYLDPDERIYEANRRNLRRLIAESDADALSLIEHIPQEERNLMKSVAESYCRVFRNGKGYQFEGRIHEQILPSIQKHGGKVEKTNIVIEHTFYGKSRRKKEDRVARNRRILLSELKQNPDDAFVLFNLGCTEREAGNKEAAKTWFTRLHELASPDLKPELLSISAVYLGQYALAEGATAEVHRMTSRALAWNARNVLGWYLEAAAAFEEQDFTRAKAALERIEEMTRDSAHGKEFGTIDRFQVYVDLGNCHYKLHEYRRAHEYYNAALEMKGDSIEAMFNNGNALLQLGERDQAALLFREIIRKNPDFEPAKENLKLCGTGD